MQKALAVLIALAGAVVSVQTPVDLNRVVACHDKYLKPAAPSTAELR